MDRKELIEKIRKLEGLTDDERSALLELANTQKRYGLVWEDKPEDVEEKLRDNLPVLTEVKERAIISDNPEAPNHILIEGDNLEALTALTYTHAGKIDVIYIDPPYNTGNKDFVYNDRFVDSEDSYRHSKWLSFMAKRLKLAKKLLNRTGYICISIDDNEYPNLKNLCDEVFLERNYQTTFHIQVRYAEKSINEEKPFKPLMEYVLIYSKDADFFNPKRELIDYGLEKFCYKIKELSKGEHFFVGAQEVIVFKPGEWNIEKIDNGSIDALKETWITGSIYTTMSYGKVFKTIVEPRINTDGIGCLYKVLGRGEDGLGFRYYTGPAKKTAKKGKMFSGVPLDKAEMFKKGQMPKRSLPILTMFDFAPDFGNIRSEGGIPFGSGKKPVKMLKQLIGYNSNNNCVVLDFFAGSGSTGHAVMQLNSEDGGNRQFILITNNENNICEDKTFVRCSNVINGYGGHPGLNENTLRYYRTELVSRDRTSANKQRLVHLATDLLCIKDDLHDEHQLMINGKKLRRQYARFFAKDDRNMIVIYDPAVIKYVVESIKEEEPARPVKVYVFSDGRYAFDDDFAAVIDKVELCALPDAIYEAYSAVLPPRKDKNVVPADYDKEDAEVELAQADSSSYKSTESDNQL